MSATKHFAGKWAIADADTNNYLSGDEQGIAAAATDITPSSTFILYSNGTEARGIVPGVVQLQGNMQYLKVGNFDEGVTPYSVPCGSLVAGAADISDAALMMWGGPTNVFLSYVSDPENMQHASTVGIVTGDGGCFLGFYTSVGGGSWAAQRSTIITPSLDSIISGGSAPNADLSYVDLTDEDLSGGLHLEGAHFEHAILTGVNLSGAFLNNAQFCQATFGGRVAFKGAVLAGADFSGCDLSGIDFTGINLTGADFSGATLHQTMFTGATLSGANFTRCDLSTIVFDATTMIVSTRAAPVILNGATLPFALIGHAWQWMDLRGATISNLPTRLSSAAQQLQATGAKLSGLNGNALTGLVLQNAMLDDAVLDGLGLSSADLSSATLTSASLHGANLSQATLTGATMLGAQLGALSNLFTTDSSHQNELEAGDLVSIVAIFAANAITLSTAATVSTQVPNRVWTITDAPAKVVYTIRLETQASGAQVLSVYAPANAATLTNAYMPNAKLSGANLYGVRANSVQFYGESAALDKFAILELAELNDANLSGVDMTEAQLYGCNLSGAKLFNARFNGAKLTPGAGVAANLSNANLQGADFTDAQLYGATLDNAAVAIELAPPGAASCGGVFLFSLDATAGGGIYVNELNAAAGQFSLDPTGDESLQQRYVNALGSGALAALTPPLQAHKPPLSLSPQAQVQTLISRRLWQIVDGADTYRVWVGTDDDGDDELYIAPAILNLQHAFQSNNIALRPQTTVGVITAGRQWALDNDSEDPQNLDLGYSQLVLQLAGTKLNVYGTAVRISRLGDGNETEIDNETCVVTKITAGNMDASTVCPNGNTLQVNQSSGASWDVSWLCTTVTPPSPPTCVPTGVNWCVPSR
jgi:uncharacterized protein YjbI with pentapeptide repeats